MTQHILQRIETLAAISEEPGRLTRSAFSGAMRRTNSEVSTWMREAGMRVYQDTLGNLIGHYPSEHPRTTAQARVFIFGSHLDTVRDAGKFDGTLGVVLALACVERLHQRDKKLPFAIEIIAFADEEGLRYHTSYLGSQAVAGTFNRDDLERTDERGIKLSEAIMAFGGDPGRLEQARKDARQVLGYCEAHIEQGPVLEANTLPVGIVTAIAGQSRYRLTFQGQAGHAGTVPMHLRADALCAAAEFVLAVEALGQTCPDLVATVGQIEAQPGASNVIPGQVVLSLDVRHQADEQRQAAVETLLRQARSIGEQRRLGLECESIHESSATVCSPRLSGLLARAVRECGQAVSYLPSGAGHDAVAMAHLTEIAMLFVRCQGGISHNPAESVQVEDIAVALDVLEHFIALLADTIRQADMNHTT